jgi:ubiquinone/menaquinone biosynthesis C-methylase UbiE
MTELTPTAWASAPTARLYDFQLALERAPLRAAIALAAPRGEELWLDLATGTGAVLRLLAQFPGRPRRAIGLDASAAMLAQVPALPTGWEVLQGDARQVPLADGTAEVVSCAYLLHLLDRPARERVLAEIARVLAPGGRVVLVTLLEPTGLAGATVLGPAQRGLCRALGPASGWCALDPTDELSAHGLVPVRRRVCRRGYASLCLLAERV